MSTHWNIVDEIRLLRWVTEFKPAGVNKHFQMMCIVERLNHPEKYPLVLLQKENRRPQKQFTAENVWAKLAQYYNLEEADLIEDQQLAEKQKTASTEKGGQSQQKHGQALSHTRDFELPWNEYGDIILEHAKKDGSEEASLKSDSTKPKEEGVKKSSKSKLRDGKERVVKKEHAEEEAEEDTGADEQATKPTKKSAPHSKEESTSGSETTQPTKVPRKAQRNRRNSEKSANPASDTEVESKEESNEKELTGGEQTDISEEKNGKAATDKKSAKTTKPVRVSARLRNKTEREEDDEAVNEEEEEDVEDVKPQAQPEEPSDKEESNPSDKEESSPSDKEGSNPSDKEESNPSDKDAEDDEKTDEEEDTIGRRMRKRSISTKQQPLAKRTRHSSTPGRSTNDDSSEEQSPKRAKRKQPAAETTEKPTRVSRRLRNRK